MQVHALPVGLALECLTLLVLLVKKLTVCYVQQIARYAQHVLITMEYQAEAVLAVLFHIATYAHKTQIHVQDVLTDLA